MKRKWEYVASVLQEHGRTAAASIAQAIDNILRDQYSLLHTNAWVEDYKDRDNTLFDAMEVAGSEGYCVACTVEHGRCEDCRFGDIAEKCSKDTSLFQQFVKLLDVE